MFMSFKHFAKNYNCLPVVIIFSSFSLNFLKRQQVYMFTNMLIEHTCFNPNLDPILHVSVFLVHCKKR
jgi:hypothetical protein